MDRVKEDDPDADPAVSVGNGWEYCEGADASMRHHMSGGDLTAEAGPPTVKMMRKHLDDVLYVAAVEELCPKFLGVLKTARKLEMDRERRTIEDGKWAVGKEVQPGTYRTGRPISDCYWERSTRGGDIIANNFVNNAPGGVTVTIEKTDGGFTSEGCGPWKRVG